MNRIRLALALLIVGGALVASPSAGGGGGSAIPTDCNCWYWQTNEHGVISYNGEKAECFTTVCAPPY